jgi:hypothetical protein
VPIDGTQDHGNNGRLIGFMALHLAAPAVIGSDEVGANQKQNDFGPVEHIVNSSPELTGRRNFAVVPRANDTLPLKRLEVLRELRLYTPRRRGANRSAVERATSAHRHGYWRDRYVSGTV